MSEPTRVAVTVEQCWHRVPGGTARAAVETLIGLRAGHPELELVGVSARHRGRPQAPFTPPVPVSALPMPRRAMYDAWHHLRRPKVEVATGPVDLIHATGLAMPPATVPVVWTLHDMAWRRDPSAFTPRGVRFFESALALARKDARLVLCSSQATIDDALAAGLPEERLRLVPLGVRAQPTTETEVEGVRRRHGLVRPYVLSVGTAEPRKNLVTLVEAVGRLRRHDVDLVVVGPQGWNEDLATLIEPLGERVRPLGFVPDTELAALYAGAAVFAYPAVWEGFGLPVLEAMAHGTPVVTSAGTSCAEVVGDAGITVGATDAAALAGAIAQVLAEPALAADLRTRGRERAAGFTWERTADLTAAAYLEALG